MSDRPRFELACPIPLSDYPRVLLAHGGGGRLMHQLVGTLFAAGFKNPHLDKLHDGAALEVAGARLAFTTDSHVVKPLVFPGGDIGTLAVNGTVNDLAMCGARPLYLSAGFIVEEGLPMDLLWNVVRSMRQAADEARVTIVTGDTKVVERGKGDGLFINTSGVGVIEHDQVVEPGRVRPGDRILLNGDVGRHGMAVLSKREGLSFETEIESDCAPLVDPVLALFREGVAVHCLRDLTRGGLAAALVEIGDAAKLRLRIDEEAVPVEGPVKGACEIFGLDPMFVANEGRFIAFVPPDQAERALAVLRDFELGADARLIGEVVGAAAPSLVSIRTPLGVERILDLPGGEQLPRIC